LFSFTTLPGCILGDQIRTLASALTTPLSARENDLRYSNHVAKWLARVGLEQFADAMDTQGVTGAQLLACKGEADYVAWGIKKDVHQRLLTKELALLHSNPSAVADIAPAAGSFTVAGNGGSAGEAALASRPLVVPSLADLGVTEEKAGTAVALQRTCIPEGGCPHAPPPC